MEMWSIILRGFWRAGVGGVGAVNHARDFALVRRPFAKRARVRGRVEDAAGELIAKLELSVADRDTLGMGVRILGLHHATRAEAEDLAVLHDHRAVRLIAGGDRDLLHGEGGIDEFLVL